MTLADGAELFDHAPCGYLVLAPDGIVRQVNSTFLELTGHDRDALVGQRTFASLLTAGGRMYHETHYMPLLQMHGRVHEIALELVTTTGDRIPVLVSSTRDDADDGSIRTVVFEARDRREYERELLRSRRAAEASEERAQSLARTLQEALIPPTPTDVPGLDIGAVYRPAGDGDEVGGDFYDVFQLGLDDWIVVLGDVCGKGVEAAAVTLLVRHTVRAVAVEGTGPKDVLTALNNALLVAPTDRFCTLVVMRLRRTDHWVVDVASGGHPLPVVLRGTDASGSLGVPGTLVGVVEEPEFHEVSAVLAPGETIVLYTDGVTEARRGMVEFGEERLRDVVAATGASVHTVTAGVLAAALDFQGGRPRDDIAVVAVRPSA
jgi:sigma-B regulation protein RsbU (phosphoserine phosphatase)